MGESYSVCTENQCQKYETDTEFDCKSAFDAEIDDIDTFIKKNYERRTEKRTSRSRRKSRRDSPRKSKSRTRKWKTDPSLNEDEKKSTEAEVEEKDIHSLLPPSPRLTDANNDKKNLKYMRDARDNAIEMWNMIDSPDWRLTNNKRHVELYKLKRHLRPSEVFIKRAMTVDAPMDKVVMWMEDCQFQLEWNSRLKTLEVVDEVGKGTSIIYQQAKGNFLVGSRDFWICSSSLKLKNNKVLLSNHSVEYPDATSEKCIRGRVNAIFLFESLSKNCTKVVNLLNVDLKGSIPSFASNKMADMQHDSFELIKKRIEEYHNSV